MSVRASLELVTPATVQPVTIDEVKDHAVIEHEHEDAWIDAAIVAAATRVREWSAKALITETWKLRLEAWPCSGIIKLPRPPLQSVTSIVYLDVDGVSQTLSSALYTVDTKSEPGTIVPVYGGAGWPSLRVQAGAPAVTITYVAGHLSRGDARLQEVRHAMLELVALRHLNREGVAEVGAAIESVANLERAILQGRLPSFNCYDTYEEYQF